jgi:hypothetical protein
MDSLNYNVPEETLEEIKRISHDWALVHGLVMYSKKTGQLTHAPFTLLPTPFPRHCFEKAWKLGPAFNTLVHQIAKHPEFILNRLKAYHLTKTQKPFTRSDIPFHFSCFLVCTESKGIHSQEI